MDEVTPFIFKIGDKLVQVKNEEKSIKLVNEFLLKNTPKMDEYYHQEWTEETFEKVAEAIIAAIPQRPILDMILEKSKDQKMNTLVRGKMRPTKSNNPTSAVKEDLDFGTSVSTPTPAAEKSQSASSAPAATTATDDEYDALFKDL